MTKMVPAIETTGFLEWSGYNSRLMVISCLMSSRPFTARKLQWAGHFKVILGNSESDYADISTQNGNEFGVHDGDYGFYVHQAGGVAPTPAGVLINLDGEVVELPTQTTLTNLHNTDAKYRMVRAGTTEITVTATSKLDNTFVSQRTFIS